MTPLLALALLAAHCAWASYPVDPRMCADAYPTVLPCSSTGEYCAQYGRCDVQARDVVFIVDGGQTWDPANAAVVNDFIKATVCQYNLTASRFGLLTTGKNVQVVRRLASIQLLSNWTTAVDFLDAQGEGTFPLAEALEMTMTQITYGGGAYNPPMVYIIASQLPQPVPVGVNFGIGDTTHVNNYTLFTQYNSIPKYWNNGYLLAGTFPEIWYPSEVCEDTSPARTCTEPYSYDQYMNKTFNAAKAITDMAGMVSVTLLPSRFTGTCPPSTLFLAQGDLTQCDDDADVSAWPNSYSWCAMYPPDLVSWDHGYYVVGSATRSFYDVVEGSWASPTECHCANVQGAIAFDAACVASPVSASALLAAVESAACAKPTVAPTMPTLRPTHSPTTPTTLAPVSPTAAPFCSGLSLPSCGDVVARDVLFVVGTGDSNNRTFLRDQLQTFAEQLTCAFDDEAGSFFGLITYGFDVQVATRLGRYTQNEWFDEMEALRSSASFDLTGGLSPLAEALQLAGREMNTFGDPTHYQLVVVLTATLPQPVDQFDGDADYPSATALSTSSLYPDQYYPSQTCDPFCETYSYNAYLGTVLPSIAASLRSQSIDVMLMALPNTDGELPDLRYYQGLPMLDQITVNPDSSVPCTSSDEADTCVVCNWCNPYPDLIDNRNECKCTYVSQPLVTQPVATRIFTETDWNVTNMIHISVATVCETDAPTANPTTRPTLGSTSEPTRAPRLRPTRRPSTSPTSMPTASPLQSHPSASPTEAPSSAPSTATPSQLPTQSPSAAPTSALPSHAPTTGAPTASHAPSRSPTTSQAPSNAPSQAAPSVSPVLASPSVSPTVPYPSTSPELAQPSTAPSYRPTVSHSPTSHSPSTSASPATSMSPVTSAPVSPTQPTTLAPLTTSAPVTSSSPVTGAPSARPTPRPTSAKPSRTPTHSHPSRSPSHSHPSRTPTHAHPSRTPTARPVTRSPSAAPSSSSPSASPSSAKPTGSPSRSHPSRSPVTTRPSFAPTAAPSRRPSRSPVSRAPTASPSSSHPSRAPSRPTLQPSRAPTSLAPSRSPTSSKPSTSPSSTRPSRAPASSSPSKSPSTSPSLSPTTPTTFQPSLAPSSSQPSTSPSVYCLNQDYTSSCPNAANDDADVILALDFGLSTDPLQARTLFDFAHQFHCRYLGAGDRMGLVLYGAFVQLVVPLAHYTQEQWDDAVDFSISAKSWGNATSPNFRGQNPVLEVFDVAYRELFQNASSRASASTNGLYYVHLVTSNLPLQVPIAQNKTAFGEPVTIPSPWAYPYPPRYLGSGTCLNTYGVPGYSYWYAVYFSRGAACTLTRSNSDVGPPIGVAYQKYITKLTAVVNELVAQGTVINVLVMPNSTGVCNSAAADFWNGVPLQSATCNTTVNAVALNVVTPCPTCNFCAWFNDQSSHEPGVTYPPQCKCASVTQALTALPVASCTTWNLTAMYDNILAASCITRSPSRSPSKAPSRTPSKAPASSQPTAAPSTSRPSRAPIVSAPSAAPSRSPLSSAPSRAPSARPSKAPSSSKPSHAPTSARPSRSPSRSPTSQQPSRSPSKSPSSAPTSSRPSASPTSARPSLSPSASPSSAPTSAKPSVSPTSSAPTRSPSKSPSLAPSSSTPTGAPTSSRPSAAPTSSQPSAAPSSASPSRSPSHAPSSSLPTKTPTTQKPSRTPTTSRPSYSPSKSPTSQVPSMAPTSQQPSRAPSRSPSHSPTSQAPSTSPTSQHPSRAPSHSPASSRPSYSPSRSPTSQVPSMAPSSSPTSHKPTTAPTSSRPSHSPTSAPSSQAPTAAPTSLAPSRAPSNAPVVAAPTFAPLSSAPSVSPTQSPSSELPTASPSSSPSSSAPTRAPASSAPSSAPSQSPTRPNNDDDRNLRIGLGAGLGLFALLATAVMTLFLARRKKRLQYIFDIVVDGDALKFNVRWYGFVASELVDVERMYKDFPRAVKRYLAMVDDGSDSRLKELAAACRQKIGRAWELGVPEDPNPIFQKELGVAP